MDNIFRPRLLALDDRPARPIHSTLDVGATLIARCLIGDWVRFYNVEGLHSALGRADPG